MAELKYPVDKLNSLARMYGQPATFSPKMGYDEFHKRMADLFATALLQTTTGETAPTLEEKYSPKPWPWPG